MLCLLFGEEPCQSYDISVDLLNLDMAIAWSHGDGSLEKLREEEGNWAKRGAVLSWTSGLHGLWFRELWLSKLLVETTTTVNSGMRDQEKSW
jgi:hypothetical protein